MLELAVTRADSRGLVARSRELCHGLRPLFATSAALVARSAELCTVFRRIAGGSDLGSLLIVEIIAASSVCLECLAKKTGIAISRASDAMERIRVIMAVTVESGCCEACLQVMTVYRLSENGTSAAPAQPQTSPPPMTQHEAIWRFLESRRGEMFCTQCIANALLATKRIDRAILGAEGRGAKRQHGRCAACGKERLLCGLAR